MSSKKEILYEISVRSKFLTLGFINDRMILTLMKHHEADFQDIQLK